MKLARHDARTRFARVAILLIFNSAAAKFVAQQSWFFSNTDKNYTQF